MSFYNLTAAFTHAGIFHADDVFSTALLRMVNPEIQIQRGMKVPDNFDGIVYDIGGGRFDHHQADSEIRENGKVLVLDTFLPWRKDVEDTQFVYIIYPSNRGGFGIQAIPDKEDEQGEEV